MGVMGLPMAKNVVQKCGLPVLGYDVVQQQMDAFRDAYFHCNFGKTGNSDGYYLVNNDGSISFETGGNTYWDTQLSVIPDIRKR